MPWPTDNKHPVSILGWVFVAAMGVGILSLPFFGSKKNPDRKNLSPVVLRTKRVEITTADKNGQILLASSGEGTPGLWVSRVGQGATVQLGLHSNGFPFVLVSDDKIKNFGLARQDGRASSPILVFRQNDEVRSVWGLDMTTHEREPFWVTYTSNAVKNLFFGAYCDAPNRVCDR